MKLDAALAINAARLRDVAQIARAAEEIGFGALWTPETQHNGFYPLLVAAEHTQRILLGTAVAIAFPRSPMVMAQNAWDLQALSGGRFILGLGTQVKAHIERRYSVAWDAPVARLRDYIAALRAIWQSWQAGERLSYQGQFYQHTLMTPFFNPGPNPYGTPRILIAAVGPAMTEVAAEVADGVLIHGFTTPKYFDEVTAPAIERGLAKAGKTRDEFTVSYPAFVVTGEDDAAMAKAAAAVRSQIGFYGSTPAYKPVLDIHGWGDLSGQLNRLSKAGEWNEMANLLSDDVLDAFAVVGAPDTVGTALAKRWADKVDRVNFYAPYALDASRWLDVADQIRAGSTSAPRGN
jgi:probable F420-dependent oxidoreductase